MFSSPCAECGKPSKGFIELATGRVEVNGKDIGQSVSLCDDHWPEPSNDVMSQPMNCKNIKFRWPKSRK